MKSQSCATAPGFDADADQRRADRAGRIDRGAGDVDADQMDGDQRQPDREAGEAGRRKRMGDAENADQEQERRHHFEHEGRDDIVFAEIARAPAVLAERAGPPLRLAGQDEIEHHRGDDRPQNLGDPVADHVGHAHPAGDIDAEAHRRIDMTAGDRPDAVGHGDDGEAERARDPQKVDRRRPRPHAPDHRRPATEEHQGERADKFGDLLVHSRPLPCPRQNRRDALIATAPAWQSARRAAGPGQGAFVHPRRRCFRAARGYISVAF